MAPDVYLALVTFGRGAERASLDVILPAVRRAFVGSRLRAAVIDNALTGEVEVELAPEVDRISGDNSWREFSGWDRGLAWLESRYAPGPGSVYVLANDTLALPSKRGRLDWLTPAHAAAAASGAFVGNVDAYPRTIQLFDRTLRQWLDASLMIGARETLHALRPLARPENDKGLFSDDWRELFRRPSPLSPNYRAYLRTWLFGERGEPQFTEAWARQAALTADNAEAFRWKIRSIVMEHDLSARARLRRIRLVDLRPHPAAIDPFDP